MGRANIYIRIENELAWKGIVDKSAWVNERLEKPLMGTPSISTGPAKPNVIITPKDAEKILENIDKTNWSGPITKSFSARKKK